MVEVLHCVLCDYALKTNDVADVLIWSSGVFRSGGGEGKREKEGDRERKQPAAQSFDHQWCWV